MNEISVKGTEQGPAPSAAQGKNGRLGPLAVFAFSVSCGLAAGLLEAGANFLAIYVVPDGITRLTRHYVWIIPLTDFCLFIGFGTALALVTKLWPRAGIWLSLRLLGGLALFPALLILLPQIYPIALLFVGTGIASVCVALFATDSSRFWLLFRTSVVPLAVAAALPPAWFFGGHAWLTWRESTQPLPARGSPNVLLLVLDTVSADHLSLYGYSRPTSPNLERIARRGIRFNSARVNGPVDASIARKHVYRAMAP